MKIKKSLKFCFSIAILFCALVYIGEYEAPMEIKSVELASDFPECPRFGKLQNCFGAYNHFNGNNISANGRTMNGMGKAQKSQFVGRHMLENTRTVK